MSTQLIVTCYVHDHVCMRLKDHHDVAHKKRMQCWALCYTIGCFANLFWQTLSFPPIFIHKFGTVAHCLQAQIFCCTSMWNIAGATLIGVTAMLPFKSWWYLSIWKIRGNCIISLVSQSSGFVEDFFSYHPVPMEETKRDCMLDNLKCMKKIQIWRWSMHPCHQQSSCLFIGNASFYAGHRPTGHGVISRAWETYNLDMTNGVIWCHTNSFHMWPLTSMFIIDCLDIKLLDCLCIC